VVKGDKRSGADASPLAAIISHIMQGLLLQEDLGSSMETIFGSKHVHSIGMLYVRGNELKQKRRFLHMLIRFKVSWSDRRPINELWSVMGQTPRGQVRFVADSSHTC